MNLSLTRLLAIVLLVAAFGVALPAPGALGAKTTVQAAAEPVRRGGGSALVETPEP